MTELLKAEHPKEGSHWYDKDGNPAHTYLNKKGEEKPTTLRQAREHALRPSVTSVIQCAARPGLEVWKQDQIILACLTMPVLEGESEADYISRIKIDAKEQARKAAERGTEIHAWVQQGFEGKIHTAEQITFYEYAKAVLEAECGPQKWIPEKSFATDRFGGKCDLHTDEYLVDIKTSDKDLASVKTWEEHHMQLAAYDLGLGWPKRKCGILYIHVTTAEARVIWLTPEELLKGWNMFQNLLGFWYAKTGL